MTVTSNCPEPKTLQAFLLGRCPPEEVDRLAAHLAQCAGCFGSLDHFRDSDVLLEAIKAPSTPRDDATSNLVDHLIARVSELTTPSGDTSTPGGLASMHEAAGPDTTQEVYHFLAPAQQPDEIGRLGVYRVLRVLGIGGMGIVFQAEDVHLRRGVALKVLRPRLLDDASARHRFLREARAAAGLAHDHIMPILHIGEDRGAPFLVMPLLAGETLEHRLQRDTTLPIADVLRIGGEIAAGLAAAHERGFIHRDIKPSNVWLESVVRGSSAVAIDKDASSLTTDLRVKILDFGLARVLGGDATLTHAGAIVGTPAYMAPEQARGEALDVRCDVFSLGCVVYRMTTGEAPFRGPTTMATLRALELVTPKLPHLLNPAVPRALSQLVGRMLAKRPAERPASAAAVAAALDAVRRAPPESTSARRPWRRVGILTAAIVVLIAASAWLYHLDSQTQRGASDDSAQRGLFAPPVNYKCGLYPRAIALGDFNRDGKLDIVVANQNSHQVSVLLGKGDGTFGVPISSAGGEWFAFSVTPGDFDGDGKLDLIVVNQGSHQISVLLGKGDGTFQPPVQYSVPASPYQVVVGDFNGDGKLDLAVASQSGMLTMLLGKGDGSFSAGVPQPINAQSQLALGDFNADGKPDLAVASSDSLTILSGKGDGTFAVGPKYTLPAGVNGVATADLNQDGRLDIAVVHGEGVGVLLGNGDGTFAPAITTAETTNEGRCALTVADFDGDGRLDIAIAQLQGNSVRVLRGKGDGTLHPGQTIPVGRSPICLAAGDFNGDGIADLAAANNNSNNISVLLAIQAPFRSSFAPAIAHPAGPEPCALATADLNADGQTDLIVANRASDTVSVLLGKGGGDVHPAVPYAAGKTPVAIALADLNGDGRLDIIAANRDAGRVSVLLGKGDGTFHEAIAHGAGKKPIAIAIADLNRDGRPDLLVVDAEGRSLRVLLGKGDGRFDDGVAVEIDSRAHCVAVGDFNGDGRLDVAIAHDRQVGSVSLLLGKGDGTFRDVVRLAVGPYPRALLAGDFNRDGKLDLVTVNWAQSDLNFFAGKGDGTFEQPVNYQAGQYPVAATLGDLSGDGKLSVIVANNNSSVSVVRGDGRGGFQAPVWYHVGAHPAAVALGRLQRDSRLDLVSVDEHSDRLSVLLSQSAKARLWLQTNYNEPAHLAGHEETIVVEAHDQDGRPDSDYARTIHFRSSDPKAVLPADYTFVPADRGRHAFCVSFGSSGAHRLTVEDDRGAWAADTATMRALGPQDILLVIGAPASVTAGESFTITITAEDRYGVLAPRQFRGTIQVTSSDRAATMPADFPFTGKEGNLYTAMNGVTFPTPGQYTIRVAELAGLAVSGSARVNVTAPR